MKRGRSFSERYGACALVVGASEGIGAAFAEEIATRGEDLLLVARGKQKLDAVAAGITARFGVSCDTLTADAGTDEGTAAILHAAGEREIGLVVYNAAFAASGNFLESALPDLVTAVRVNSLQMLSLIHPLAATMTQRKRGGIVILCSLAGFQGAPGIATYGATKAFNVTLAEGLYSELKPHGVDVIGCVAGATSTPGFARTMGPPAGDASRLTLDDARGYPFWVMAPRGVARAGLHHLGRKPIVVAGAVNKIAAFTLRHFFSRRTATRFMGNASGLSD